MTVGRQRKLIDLLDSAGMTANMVQAVIDRPQLTAKMIAVLQENLNPQLFVSGEQQIENVRTRFGGINGFFADWQIQQASEAMPDFEPEGLKALVLTPYFNNLQQTDQWLWATCKEAHPNNWSWESLKSDPQHMRLLEGTEFPANSLQWEIIDFGANRGESPVDTRDTNSPHMTCLAAAWHHTKWVEAMDGEKVPYIWIPGLEVTVFEDKPFECVPNLSQFDGKLKRYAYWHVNANSHWAVPCRVESRNS